MHSSFPRYREYDPLVPVWCVTPHDGGCIHRFFDTSPVSPSGKYLAFFRMPFEDRQPAAGEPGQVCVVDLTSAEERVVAETCGWEPQTGANLNWGASDDALYFNDVNTATWEPFAWKLNPLTGERRRMEGTVYHASPDGHLLISANMAAMRRTQPGYGVQVPDHCVRWNVGAVPDDGFYITDTETGKCRLLISIREILERADPPVLIADPDQYEIYGFHSKFDPTGDRLMLSLRWYPVRERHCFNMFGSAIHKVRYAWVTTTLDGSRVRCAVGPEQWEKGGHHATWFPDGRRISMNLDLDRERRLRFVQVNADGSGLCKMHGAATGSGHPTVHPDNRHILTDAYIWEEVAFKGGTVPLRWIDLHTGDEQTVVRINTKKLCSDPVLRVDPHPAWDRTYRFVTFNAIMDGTSRVYIADMRELIT